ncbi:hypothetical protein Ocin01_18334 [Orchesella cincta]|uniref:DNA-directed RNA polymerase II subunit RPB1 n=1 Tax=Orchesella cincta TaxID=48709 RepID=A0A1D2M5U9_ORCCI|nr:hypothetical protein Ocin01_18334 [Orchesella cincta]
MLDNVLRLYVLQLLFVQICHSSKSGGSKLMMISSFPPAQNIGEERRCGGLTSISILKKLKFGKLLEKRKTVKKKESCCERSDSKEELVKTKDSANLDRKKVVTRSNYHDHDDLYDLDHHLVHDDDHSSWGWSENPGYIKYYQANSHLKASLKHLYKALRIVVIGKLRLRRRLLRARLRALAFLTRKLVKARLRPDILILKDAPKGWVSGWSSWPSVKTTEAPKGWLSGWDWWPSLLKTTTPAPVKSGWSSSSSSWISDTPPGWKPEPLLKPSYEGPLAGWEPTTTPNSLYGAPPPKYSDITSYSDSEPPKYSGYTSYSAPPKYSETPSYSVPPPPKYSEPSYNAPPPPNYSGPTDYSAPPPPNYSEPSYSAPPPPKYSEPTGYSPTPSKYSAPTSYNVSPPLPKYSAPTSYSAPEPPKYSSPTGFSEPPRPKYSIPSSNSAPQQPTYSAPSSYNTPPKYSDPYTNYGAPHPSKYDSISYSETPPPSPGYGSNIKYGSTTPGYENYAYQHATPPSSTAPPPPIAYSSYSGSEPSQLLTAPSDQHITAYLRQFGMDHTNLETSDSIRSLRQSGKEEDVPYLISQSSDSSNNHDNEKAKVIKEK